MRIKKLLAVICMVGLSCSILAGCGQSKEKASQSSYWETSDFTSYIESVRQQGYHQAYLELQYGFGGCISEESYNQYLEAKQQYEEDMTSEHLNDLMLATQVALKELQSAKSE